MKADKYKVYASRASDELDDKQTLLLADFGIGTFADFMYDQATGKLEFMDSRGIVRVAADATPLGSFSCRTNTWHWAWSNDSILPGLRARAEVVRKLSKVTNKDFFEKPKFKASETKAWELAAVCVRFLGSSGCYRIPNKHLHVFLALDNLVKKRASEKRRPKAKKSGHG